MCICTVLRAVPIDAGPQAIPCSKQSCPPGSIQLHDLPILPSRATSCGISWESPQQSAPKQIVIKDCHNHHSTFPRIRIRNLWFWYGTFFAVLTVEVGFPLVVNAPMSPHVPPKLFPSSTRHPGSILYPEILCFLLHWHGSCVPRRPRSHHLENCRLRLPLEDPRRLRVRLLPG
jgi:hypothetical protein